ncbi:MAG: response regulator [Pseudomonadota bacterium]|nr:response regulator [Pseudomonadota bacterium]
MAKIAFDELRFVVVDDNAHMRRIVRTLLRAFGSREIYESEDGASGLEAVEAYSPDILISDIKMPIFDGIELTRMIRNPEGCKHPYLPIIILTGYSEKKHVLAARDAGATEFLCKPVSATALYRRIQNIVENPRDFVRTKNYFGPDRRRYINPNYSGVERRQAAIVDDMFDSVQVPAEA